MSAWVIDTNVLLDVWVFDDPRTLDLGQALSDRTIHWLATPAMREEWERVLHYPHLVGRRERKGLSLADLMARFDRAVQLQTEAARAPWACKDPDDQKFIDLAVACRANLLSKDQEVLRMRKRLALAGVVVASQWPAPATT